MQIFTLGNVVVDNFTVERSAFQHLHQNQTSESVGFFGIRGVLKGDLADRRDEISQGSIDVAIIGIYFHVDSPSTCEQQNSEDCFERPADQSISARRNAEAEAWFCMFKLAEKGLPSKIIHF